MATPGPTVNVKCAPDCESVEKVFLALLVAAENQQAAQLDLDLTGKDVTTARFDSYVGEAVIVAILIGVVIVVRVRAGAYLAPELRGVQSGD